MARPEKVAVVDEVRDSFTGSAATLLTDYRGLTVAELAALRAELRKAGATYKVAKNTLTRRAAADAGLDGLEELLTGPTALVFCGEDPVGPAKALKRFKGEHPALEIKGGYLDGEVLDAAAALGLAELASREELLAKLAGLMQGALSGFARLLNALPEQQARLLQALVDAGGVEARGFSPTAPAAAETVADAAGDAAATADDAVTGATADAIETAADAAETAAEAAEGAAEAAEDATEDAAGTVEGTVESVADVAEAAVETAADAAETAVETAADVTEAAIDTAADATETVIDAAASAVGAATDAVEQAAEAVTGGDDDTGADEAEDEGEQA